MRESLDRSGSSSLAVVEKRQYRPGGCSGVFFQLLDWNRKFAKRLLFSKKVLPSASHSNQKRRLQKLQATKLLQTVNEKGKLSLDVIHADELQRCMMQVPGLLPRLMGLESIPIVKRGKNKKDTKGNNCSEFGGTEKVDIKREAFEKRAMARLGSEAIHLKSTLSRKNHIKLPTPTLSLPSWKASSNWHHGRGASKIIDAATRILEPGLHSETRTKQALMCPNYLKKYTRSVENKTRIPPLDEGGLSAPVVGDRGLGPPKMGTEGTCSSISGFQERHTMWGGADVVKPIPVTDDVRTNFVAWDHPFGATTTPESSESCVGGVTHFSSEDCYAGGDSVQPGTKVDRRFCCRVSDIPAIVGNLAQRPVVRNGLCYSRKDASERGCRDGSLGFTYSVGQGAARVQKESEIFAHESECKMDDSRKIREDTVSMFLQRKLRELNREEECLMGGRVPKTPIIVILQEIIHVLSREQHILQQHELSGCQRLSACASSSDFEISTLCEEASTLPESVTECMQLSPGSVLEASFSTDSHFTSSLGDVVEQLQHSQAATSYMEEAVAGNVEVAHIIDSISAMLDNSILSRSSSSSLDYIVSTILHSEFLFKREEQGPLFPLLFYSLKAFVHNEEETAITGDECGRFLFDSLLEYLEMYCVDWPMLGFQVWSRLGSRDGTDGLVREIYKEMRKWGGFQGSLDGRMEGGMGEGPWTGFGAEVYETALYVSNDVIDGLVGEVVLDF